MEQKWRIITAVGLGLLAVGLTYIYWQKKEATLEVKEVPVIIAAQSIPKGTVISQEMLAIRPVPEGFVQPGAFGSPAHLVGKLTGADINAGEQILVTKLTTPTKGLALAVKTPPGKRAASVGLEAASAVAGMIKPGDHVDVLAIFTRPSVIITLFQDVLVLAVDQKVISEGMVEEDWRQEATVNPKDAKTVTLALSPQEVQILTVAMEEGKIQLTLRPQQERGKAIPSVDLSQLPPAVDLETLLKLYVGSAAPEEKEEGPSVEVIRGLKREITPIPVKK